MKRGWRDRKRGRRKESEGKGRGKKGRAEKTRRLSPPFAFVGYVHAVTNTSQKSWPHIMAGKAMV